MKFKAKSMYLFLLIFMCNLGVALSQKLHFTKVSPPPESRSWGLITGMMQDSSGYMWFTTDAGVHKYDGYNFKSFVNDPLDPKSMAPNSAECILEDSEGIIWIGTTGAGLERLDPVSGKFTHFVHSSEDPESIIHNDVKAIFEDHQGVFWIGTGSGLEIFDRKTQKFKHFTSDINDATTISNNCVKMIYEDADKTLWFGTGEAWGGDSFGSGGLNRFDRKTENFTRFLHDENDPLSLVDNRVRAILEDSQGNFWVGTAGDGLHLMDRGKGTFQRLSFDPLDPQKLSRPALQPPPMLGAVDHITFIKEDAKGIIWIGTMGAGINCYDPKTKKITHFGGDQSEGGLKDMKMWSSFISRDGVIWMSSIDYNLFRVNPLQTRVDDINIGAFAFDIYQEDSDITWLGSLDGLYRSDLKTGIQTAYTHDPLIPSSISQGIVTGIVPDDLNGLWVATDGGGLNRFDPETASFTHYRHDENDLGSLDNDTIGAILADRQLNLWVGTNHGLNLLKSGSKQFIHYQHDSLNIGSISDSFGLSSLLEDIDPNYLWVGTFGGGLNRFDRASGKFDHFLPDAAIFGMVQDQDGIIWVTSNEGLSRYEIKNNKFEKFLDPNGVFEIGYTGIQVDDQNNLWLTGLKGIWQINNDRTLIHSYSHSNGVTSFNFYSRNIFKDNEGAMCFPHYPGSYYRITPDQLTQKVDIPLIVISDFRLEIESVIPGDSSPLKVPINEETKINLKYDQNIFSFDFAAINYTSPESNSLFFMLENYDKDWRNPGSDKSVQYINVPPGNYIFRIKAATNMGAFTEREIQVEISPPWWKTGWAYGLYAIIFGALIFTFDKFMRNRIVRLEREKSQEKELAQAKEIEKAYTALKATQSQLIQSEKMASLGELTAGIAHEIQNPLNFVNNFSEVSNELIDEMVQEIENKDFEEVKTIAQDVKKNLDKINHHGKRADAIVKGMLQHSRSSDGKKEPTNINALADEYLRLAYHGLRAKDKSFNASLKTDFDDSVGLVNLASQDIGRVILNLITNAFFAVDEKKKSGEENYEPTVSVSTKKRNKKLEITVSDNGNGMPKKVLKKIFQPFFTTKPTGQGTGLGLSLSYDIVKAHGGELKVVTKQGEGSQFIIILPV